MSHRALLLLLLLAFALPARGGWWEDGNPGGIGRIAPLVQLRGAIRGFELRPQHGRSVVVTLPTPRPLDAPLVLPPGPWAEITLIMDAPVQVVAPDGQRRALSVERLTVPLDDPDAREIHLEWTLPAGPLPADPARLLALLEDGGMAW